MKAAKAVRDAVEAESSGKGGKASAPQGAFARTVAESRKALGKRKREDEGDAYVAWPFRKLSRLFGSSEAGYVAWHQGEGLEEAMETQNASTIGAVCAKETFEGAQLDLSESPLHCIQWGRVILDEAHRIKGRTNSTALAAYALQVQKGYKPRGLSVRCGISQGGA